MEGKVITNGWPAIRSVDRRRRSGRVAGDTMARSVAKKSIVVID
jgi:hypothetical protein